MPKRLTVVISQGQSASPDKRKLEEDLVAGLLFESGIEVAVIPHLYDLTPDGTGMLCLRGITGDLVVMSWIFPRAAHWTLDRHGVRGRLGVTLLQSAEREGDDEAEEGDSADERADVTTAPSSSRPVPNRAIYHLDLRACNTSQPYLEEIKRIATETSVQAVELGTWKDPAPVTLQLTTDREAAANFNGFISLEGLSGSTAAEPLAVEPSGSSSIHATTDNGLIQPGGPIRIEESPARRWYPVIDYSRCTNCMECIDFCLFGVYGVDGAETILVEQPDNCRKGCPACSRVCPENAIIFPQHKTPAIAGSPDGISGGLKIDLSQLFGAPNAIEVAAQERDGELVAAGRDAVGLSVGIPKRQVGKPQGPKDDLDSLMDELDRLDL